MANRKHFRPNGPPKNCMADQLQIRPNFRKLAVKRATLLSTSHNWNHCVWQVHRLLLSALPTKLLFLVTAGSNSGSTSLGFLTRTFWSFFAETNWSLKHFGNLSHSCSETHCNSVHYPIFQTLWLKWLNIFQSFQKHFSLWPKKNSHQCLSLAVVRGNAANILACVQVWSDFGYSQCCVLTSITACHLPLCCLAICFCFL